MAENSLELILSGEMKISSRKAHIPDAIMKTIRNKSMGYIINAKTVILCNPKDDVETVLKSLKMHIEHIKMKSGL